MRISTRLIALLCAIAALFVAWVFYVQYAAQRQAELLLSTNVHGKNTAFDRILKLESAPFEAFVYDVSIRDDFFAFMQKPARAWAEVNLAGQLQSYKLNGAWIYDRSLACIYAASFPGGELPREVPVPRQALAEMLGQRYFYRFFVWIDAGLLELRCAPIQPADDWERKSPPRGFLFVGRLWNQAYIDEISALTESRVTLRPIAAGSTVAPPSFDFSRGMISFCRVFYAWDDVPIAELGVQSDVPVLHELSRSARSQLLQLLVFLSIILAVLILAFVCWVQLPLRKLSGSLVAGNPAPLARLQKQRTEYGDFARLIVDFFRQQQELAAEINERRHAQEQLEATNDMLRAREQTLQSMNQQIAASMQQLQASQHTLRESEERYRSLVEHIELGIALITPDFRIVMVNSKCADIYGRPAAHFADRFCYDEFDKCGKVCAFCPGVQAMRTGAMAQAETQRVHDDGTVFDVKLMAFPVLQSGSATGFVMLSEDITARKKLENAMRESEALFRTQFELGNIGIAIAAPDRRWLRVNHRLCSMLGYTEAELCGMTWADVTHADDLAASAEEFEKMLAGEIDSYDLDKRYVCKNGDIVWTHLAASCVREQDGSVRFVIASIQDITQRRLMEEQLRQAQKMEAIGTLAGGIAHDFNNILAAIVGNAELALLELPPAAPAAGKVSQILRASDRARDLVRQILAFSRQQEQERRPVDICLLVNEALKLLRSIVPTTIELRHKVPADAFVIEGDPTRIHQVIINLCANAAQAMEADGGVLTLEVSSIQVDGRSRRYHGTPHGRYVRIAVSDTGPGIEPRHLPRIFDPFFTTKGVGKGTGMGLAVAHGIVKDHGGTMTAYSRPGRGAVFYILLPQISSAVAEPPEELPEIPRGEGTVLLVDDEEMLADMGATILKSLGYAVVSCTSSPEALNLFTKNTRGFDAVITDFTMPFMTGYELAKELLRIRPDIPIILCTGFSNQISEEQAQAAGIRTFIMKPYNMREIGAALQQLLHAGQPDTGTQQAPE